MPPARRCSSGASRSPAPAPPPLLGANANATGTLNLNGGTLTITTTGAAITGGGGTSDVSFNGGTLRAGASSTGWIQNLTTATVDAGGVTFDSNGFDVTIPQVLTAWSPSGGITKTGAGSVTLTGNNTYTGGSNLNITTR